MIYVFVSSFLDSKLFISCMMIELPPETGIRSYKTRTWYASSVRGQPEAFEQSCGHRWLQAYVAACARKILKVSR